MSEFAGMVISVTCGQCGAKFRANPQHAGKRAKCPKCAGMLEIPSLPVHPEQKGAEAAAYLWDDLARTLPR